MIYIYIDVLPCRRAEKLDCTTRKKHVIVMSRRAMSRPCEVTEVGLRSCAIAQIQRLYFDLYWVGM